jgi:hypothetical protein
LDRADVRHLYFITAIENVPSIMEHGLLSNRGAAKLPHVDISMQSVQDIRATKRVPGGFVLHDYANLYVCARNPMLYKRSREMLDELCVLAFHPSVLDLDDVVIADHNAAAGVAGFAPYPEGLEAINSELTFARWWIHDDFAATERHRKRMCAEVLVPQGIHPSFIQGAYVGSKPAMATFEALDTGLKVVLNRDLFFET